MNASTKNRGGGAPSECPMLTTVPRDRRGWWTAVYVSISRGVGLVGLGCVIAGCRAGTPAEWTMQRMAMSEAWYEHARAHQGQDANYQEGWRNGYAEGRSSFSQAWVERDPAQFEAFVWERREQAQASWRQGYDAGFSAAREQNSKHGNHATLFGTPSLVPSHQPADPLAGVSATVPSVVESLPATLVPSLSDPARTLPVAAAATEAFVLEPVPSQVWTPSTHPAARAPLPSAASSDFPADAAASLTDAIRRSLDFPATAEVGSVGPVGDPDPEAAEAAPEPLVPPPLDLTLDDDDVARHARPRVAAPAFASQVVATPRLGGPQLGQTISNPYFTGAAPTPSVGRSTESVNAKPAADEVTTSFPRTSHRDFQPNRPIDTAAALPPAVLAQHTTPTTERVAAASLPSGTAVADAGRPAAAGAGRTAATSAMVGPLPKHLPLRPRR